MTSITTTMTTTTTSLDDQQERHYIGSLLSDEDVFGQTNGRTIETNGNASGGLQSGNVLPSSGPIGPTPNRTFWPEPPPPYSPCSTVTSPQWGSAAAAAVGRQGSGLLVPPLAPPPPPSSRPPPPPVAGPYGQTPTATAVTRTDFYQSPFGTHAEWENIHGATTMDAYMPTGISYSPHRTVSILKPLMTTGGTTMDTMQQHHYQNMFRHHQRHLGGSQVDPRLFTAPPPPPTPIYSSLDETGLVHIDSYLSQHLPPKAIKKTTSAPPLPVDDVTLGLFSPVTTGTGIASKSPAPPLGKSYRDVASKKEHVISSGSLSSLLSNPATGAAAAAAPIRHTSSISSAGGGKNGGNGPVAAITKRMTSTNRINGNRQTNGGEFQASSPVNDVSVEERDEANIHHKNTSSKKGVNRGKKTATATATAAASDNEFQKITHKKNKGGVAKTNKNEQVITDEDGLAGNQAVDASSRFDVLLSLGIQATNAIQRRVIRRSLSPVITTHRQTDTTPKLKVGNLLENADRDTATVTTDGDVMSEDKTSNEYGNNGTKRPSLTTQRSLLKKVLGAQRELSVHAAGDTARGGRKQRNSAKKRQSTLADYINIIGALIFSVIKCAVRWIVDLIMDISLQLWDITVYTIVAGYTSIIYNCQRCWYSTVGAVRSFWENIRLFSTKKIWANEKEFSEWGLNDNIQLPLTGEEAMERILKCRGRDAYAVLGLRADCTSDDIKRYYKRQAILVHPDKNRLSGADEAFKILSKAFDAIGTPDARNKYNIANLRKNPLHKEMEELWERLREKMNEARNAMYCDCGSKHTRIPVESIRASEARYCKKCKLRHPAKHNDIWAETRFGGFIWVYYACLDGVVYDITQWATCSSNHLKHMKANSHAVQYRLVTTTGPSLNSKNPLKQNRTGQQQRRDYDDLCYYNRGGQQQQHYQDIDDTGCGCSVPLGYGADPGTAAASSQQATYRPPERNPFNGDRPRRAGRRRKQR